jgi:ATP-dependent Lon protease
MTSISGERLPTAFANLPVFPLADIVLFPGIVLPLHVFEPRYQLLLRDCLASHKVMAVACIDDDGEVDSNGNPRFARVGGAGLVIEHEVLADGRSNLLLKGQCRVSLEELPFVSPYRRVSALRLDDRLAPVADSDRIALLSAATAFVTEIKRSDATFAFRPPYHLEPGAFADVCAHHLVVEGRARQSVLEVLDVADRVRLVTRVLSGQLNAMRRREGEEPN